MKSWNYLHSYNQDGSKKIYVELYEQPAWREFLSPLMWWICKRIPRWAQPGGLFPASRSNDDGTCTFLWPLRLELFLIYDFEHDKRKVLHHIHVKDA